MPSLEYKFGVVDQIYTLLPNNFSVGDSVMFKGNDSQPYVKDGLQYYLIEETKIILTENPSLP